MICLGGSAPPLPPVGVSATDVPPLVLSVPSVMLDSQALPSAPSPPPPPPMSNPWMFRSATVIDNRSCRATSSSFVMDDRCMSMVTIMFSSCSVPQSISCPFLKCMQRNLASLVLEQDNIRAHIRAQPRSRLDGNANPMEVIN